MSAGSLRGRTALVTGASGHLGRAMVHALTEAGARVHAVARTAATLEEAFAGNELVSTHPCDVTSDAFPALVDEIGSAASGLDVLVNNAHIGRGGSLRTSTQDNFNEAFELGVVSIWRTISAARPHLARAAAHGSPSIVNISSMYGLVSPDPRMYDTEEGRNPPFYGAAKAALLQLTRYAAAELGPEGIRVNAIVPGTFPGPAAQSDAAFMERLAQRTMLGRVGQPEDLGPALLMLASPDNRFMTGSTVVVDGGWTAW